MRKNDELYLSKTLYKMYGITTIKVEDITKETELGICVFWNKGNKEIWLPKNHILLNKPNYQEVGNGNKYED